MVSVFLSPLPYLNDMDGEVIISSLEAHSLAIHEGLTNFMSYRRYLSL